jgi:GH24 family phage-related lysozyme (muramidase)
MPITIHDAAQYRDKLKVLDLKKPDDAKLYKQYRRELFIATEGLKPTAYLLRGIWHVGIGFNMQRPNAKQDWKEALGEHGADFDRVLEQKQALTKFHIDQLFAYSMRKVEHRLIQMYGRATWEALRPNERLAIESMCYLDGEQTVNPQTRFYKYIKEYTNGEQVHASA